jgi:hypothetical protein
VCKCYKLNIVKSLYVNIGKLRICSYTPFEMFIKQKFNFSSWLCFQYNTNHTGYFQAIKKSGTKIFVFTFLEKNTSFKITVHSELEVIWNQIHSIKLSTNSSQYPTRTSESHRNAVHTRACVRTYTHLQLAGTAALSASLGCASAWPTSSSNP